MLETVFASAVLLLIGGILGYFLGHTKSDFVKSTEMKCAELKTRAYAIVDFYKNVNGENDTIFNGLKVINPKSNQVPKIGDVIITIGWKNSVQLEATYAVYKGKGVPSTPIAKLQYESSEKKFDIVRV